MKEKLLKVIKNATTEELLDLVIQNLVLESRIKELEKTHNDAILSAKAETDITTATEPLEGVDEPNEAENNELNFDEEVDTEPIEPKTSTRRKSKNEEPGEGAPTARPSARPRRA